MTTRYRKPLPDLSFEEGKEFWTYTKKHELRIPRCVDCGTYRWRPRPMCANCYSMNTEWVRTSGKGTLYTWTVVHHPMGEAWVSEVPYAVAVVTLDEGVRLVSNILDCPPEELRAGMPLEVVFEDVTDEITLPKFRPVR